MWQLVELIDGYRHVASIAQTANGDIDVIKSRVANLVWVAVNFVSSAIDTAATAAATAVHSG